jgi:hypothetical protein
VPAWRNCSSTTRISSGSGISPFGPKTVRRCSTRANSGQKASCLYERLALSRDKEGIRKLAKEGQVIVRPEDLLKQKLEEWSALEAR